MNEELIIDLSISDNALRQDNKHLFHRRVYERLSQVIKTQLARTKDYLKKGDKDNINHSRSHDAILLDGERGTGKTWVLVNLQGFIEREPEFVSITEDVLFLDPVDPTLLSDHEDFLNIVVGQINKSPSVKRRLDTSKADRCDVYYRHLEDLATALEGEQSSKDRVGLDRLLSYQGSLDIAQNAHEYFREVLEFTGKRLIVLSIDDVDMSLCHGFKVLEVVRKYLCSPYVLPIVSGDLRLYQELVENKFCEQLVHGQSSTSKERQIKKIEELTNEYLRKVFPAQQRIIVPTIESYCQKSTGESTKVQNGAQSLGNLYGIHQLLLTALNGRVNGEENSAVSYAPRTARELMQLLNALRPVLEKLLDNEFPPLKYVKPNVTYTYTKDDITRWWLNLPKPTKESPHVYNLYTILSIYFSYSQQLSLRELSEALKKLNHVSDSADLSELAYFSPVRQLKLNDAVSDERPNENYDNYIKDTSPFIKQADRLPPGLRDETARLLTALPAIEPIDVKLKFTKSYFDECKKNRKEEDFWEFLLYLFSHGDYYTSYQTAPLVFFGRFFELITTSLIRDIDSTWLRELLTKPPYYSILSISATKTFDIEEEEEDQIGNYIGISERNLRLDTGHLNKIADEINQFRHEITRENDGVVPVFADISLFTALQSKYFNQLNLYKKAGYIPQNKKRIRPFLRDNDLLKEIAIRAAYTYWGALGSFEKSRLFFKDDLDSVVHQNFFDVSTDARTSKIRSNQAYSHNISPFIKKNAVNPSSFTSQLGKHPVYKFIRNLTVDDRFDYDEAQVATKRRESTIKATNYEAISGLLKGNFLTKTRYEKLLNLPDNDNEARKSVEDLLIKFYSEFEMHISNTTEEANELIANAKLGAIIKDAKLFDYSKSLDRLLHLTRKKLLNMDDAALIENKEEFSKRLLDVGVKENIVKLLAEGI